MNNRPLPRVRYNSDKWWSNEHIPRSLNRRPSTTQMYITLHPDQSDWTKCFTGALLVDFHTVPITMLLALVVP